VNALVLCGTTSSSSYPAWIVTNALGSAVEVCDGDDDGINGDDGSHDGEVDGTMDGVSDEDAVDGGRVIEAVGRKTSEPDTSLLLLLLLLLSSVDCFMEEEAEGDDIDDDGGRTGALDSALLLDDISSLFSLSASGRVSATDKEITSNAIKIEHSTTTRRLFLVVLVIVVLVPLSLSSA
jgi:hypothetical protein